MDLTSKKGKLIIHLVSHVAFVLIMGTVAITLASASPSPRDRLSWFIIVMFGGMAIGNLIRVVITLIRIKRLKVQSDV